MQHASQLARTGSLLHFQIRCGAKVSIRKGKAGDCKVEDPYNMHARFLVSAAELGLWYSQQWWWQNSRNELVRNFSKKYPFRNGEFQKEQLE